MDSARIDSLSLSKLSLADQPVASCDADSEAIELLSLPDELLEGIASVLHEERKQKSLLNLIMCSKRLRDVGIPFLWKDLRWKASSWKGRVRGGAIPPEWQYVEYICFEGTTTAFWEGLRSDLGPEEFDLIWQDVLLKRWPKLKAVIEIKQKRPFVLECPVHSVYICSRDHMIERTTENLISRIIKIVYGGLLSVSRLARESLGIAIPRFTTYHQLTPMLEEPTITAPKSGLPNGSDVTRKGLPSKSDPDANISDSLLLGLDLHLLLDAAGEDPKETMLSKGFCLHALCRMTIQTLDTPKLSLLIVCENAMDIFLRMLLMLEAKLAGERPPHILYAKFPNYQSMTDFGNGVMEAQHWICDRIFKPGEDGGIEESTLPSRIIVASANDPSRPQPNCKHAEIDLRDYETSRVVRFGQCIHGRTDHRAYRDGTMMTEDEFKRWKIRTKATFAEEKPTRDGGEETW